VKLYDTIALQGGFTRNANGFLVANATIAREGVLDYQWWQVDSQIAEKIDKEIIRVFRSAAVLGADMSSYDSLAVVDFHMGTDVSVKDKEQIRGLFTEARLEDGKIKGRITITDNDTIYDVEHNGKRELSLGYDTEVQIMSGNFNGENFDVEITKILPNHVAVVEKGRCGPECAIGDSAGCGCQSCEAKTRNRKPKPTESNTMTDKLAQTLVAMAVMDSVVNVAQADVPAFNALKTKLADQATTISERDATISEKDGEIATLKAQLEDAENKLKPEAIGKLVEAAAAERGAILTKASTLLDSADLKGTNADIMRKAIAKANGVDVTTLADSDESFLKGAFGMIKEAKGGTNGKTFSGSAQDSVDGDDVTTDEFTKAREAYKNQGRNGERNKRAAGAS